MVDSLKSRSCFSLNDKKYAFYSLKEAGKSLKLDLSTLPCSLKILLENLLRNEDGEEVSLDDIKKLAACTQSYDTSHEISFKPSRVLMQDFTGVPAIVDLASMRSFLSSKGKDPLPINPLISVDLIIDHSVQVDFFGDGSSFVQNVQMEMSRNKERYEFLKWGQSAFRNFRVVPPGTGICHQVNLEYLAKVVCGDDLVYPDSVVGTDSHTTMVNGLSVLGWGVGGIEAEAVMLGQSISMLIPEVIGFRLTGKLQNGVTATDLVLTITNILRARGVVNKFVEFYGDGLDYLSLPDRATIANMAPEYGATCGFFPVDQKTIEYLTITGRDQTLINLVEFYSKEQGLWRDDSVRINFFDTLELDLSTVIPVMAGPKRPQDKIKLSEVQDSVKKLISSSSKDAKGEVNDGDVVIAAITSCTNTSNPNVLIAAGLVARNAVSRGLKVKPWVKTSLAPGSQVVTEYLKKSGLQDDLDQLGFNLVGYGCTTCIGNSGPLDSDVESEIKDRNLVVCAVLSGNRNFEGRVHPLVKANFLASPPLVVIYALAGTTDIDLTKDPICKDGSGKEVYLSDLWPDNKEIEALVAKSVMREMFIEKYQNVFSGGEHWEEISSSGGDIYNWDLSSTYIQNPPYFDNLSIDHKISESVTCNINGAHILALLGDSITTDHISPAGDIANASPAGLYLRDKNIDKKDFNSYGSRRGNHHVMMRGTFANIRIKNEMVDSEGGLTKFIPSGEIMPIFDAAMEYGSPLVIIAGKEYGSGSSRDWAAKGTLLLNVKAVIAESFERIHRSNLIGMGVIPLLFPEGQNRKTLKLEGDEKISISGNVSVRSDIDCTIERKNGEKVNLKLICNVNTLTECRYLNCGGVLQFVLLNLSQSGRK